VSLYIPHKVLARWAKKIIPNIDMVPKSGKDGKFQFPYFSLKVGYMAFPTSLLSPKSAK
jgi:hypothetical protein